MTSTSRATPPASSACSRFRLACGPSRIRSWLLRTPRTTVHRRCPMPNRRRRGPTSWPLSSRRVETSRMTNMEVGAPAAPPAEKRTHKLWGGRFGGGPTPEFDALNNSIGVDFRLWPYDVRLSKAWAVALWGAGVLTLEESKSIESGLDA